MKIAAFFLTLALIVFSNYAFADFSAGADTFMQANNDGQSCAGGKSKDKCDKKDCGEGCGCDKGDED